jgi:Uma2 family endonuclease
METHMAGAPQQKAPRLTVDLFRAFYATRLDEERWELINGAAVRMPPPTPGHQRIAGNLERLLLDALERHDPSRTVYQRLGLNLASVVDNYDPEPDVVVVDAEGGDERYSDTFYSQPRSCPRATAPTSKASAKSTSCTHIASAS